MKNVSKAMSKTEKYFEIISHIESRKKAKFFNECKNYAETMEYSDIDSDSVFAIYPQILARANEIVNDVYTKDATVKDYEIATMNLYACGVCALRMEQTKKLNLDLFSYIHSYAMFKIESFKRLRDLGAYGDLIETICHLLVNEKIWRVKINNLHVSAIGNLDLKYKGIKFEVGTNGKTFLDSTELDIMAGKYDGLIYGMFSDEDKRMIDNYVYGKDIFGLIDFVSCKLYVFINKNDFPLFLSSITESKVFRFVNHHYMVVCNNSRCKLFDSAIYDSDFPSLHDYMLSINENNDFIQQFLL